MLEDSDEAAPTWIRSIIGITTERGRNYDENPPHPGKLLREDVLRPLGIEVTDAAHRLGISRTTLSRVINGRSGISPDLAIRLERAGVSTARSILDDVAGQLRAIPGRTADTAHGAALAIRSMTIDVPCS